MNVNKDVFENRWDEYLLKVLNWRKRGREDQLIKVNSLHERSIRILQQRYGYTREQAISELTKHYFGTWLG